MKACKGGEHTLKTILSVGNDMSQKVVRWCAYCGAIVVDMDYDGRTNPGAVLPMQFPAILKENNDES
jgi:hypothetical protein